MAALLPEKISPSSLVECAMFNAYAAAKFHGCGVL